MFKGLSLVFLLFAVGILGSSFPLFMGRDGTSLIVIGFGFGLLHLNSRIQEGHIAKDDLKGIGLLAAIVTLISLASMAYNVYKFNTTFNKVLLVGFIVLMIWNIVLTFSLIRSKGK